MPRMDEEERGGGTDGRMMAFLGDFLMMEEH
jgi:hypothetical protein